MGSDLSVVNAARVSFAKISEWDSIPEAGEVVGYLKLRDEKLINYLAKHGHWTPFGHSSLQFHIKAPVFVARQLVKHQVGLVWNEVSRRYVDYEPDFYSPQKWRLAADNKKQQPPQADPNKVYNIPIGDSYSKGPKDAAVTIIEWSDFQ